MPPGPYLRNNYGVNDVLEKDDEIKAGDIVITGSLSKYIPSKPGKYADNYGNFGKIEFECN